MTGGYEYLAISYAPSSAIALDKDLPHDADIDDEIKALKIKLESYIRGWDTLGQIEIEFPSPAPEPSPQQESAPLFELLALEPTVRVVSRG